MSPYWDRPRVARWRKGLAGSTPPLSQLQRNAGASFHYSANPEPDSQYCPSPAVHRLEPNTGSNLEKGKIGKKENEKKRKEKTIKQTNERPQRGRSEDAVRTQ